MDARVHARGDRATARHSAKSIAKKYNLTANDILLQYESNGYGWLFHQHVLDAARAYARKKP